jgi:hypothetical protein
MDRAFVILAHSVSVSLESGGYGFAEFALSSMASGVNFISH